MPVSWSGIVAAGELCGVAEGEFGFSGTAAGELCVALGCSWLAACAAAPIAAPPTNNAIESEVAIKTFRRLSICPAPPKVERTASMGWFRCRGGATELPVVSSCLLAHLQGLIALYEQADEFWRVKLLPSPCLSSFDPGKLSYGVSGR